MNLLTDILKDAIVPAVNRRLAVSHPLVKPLQFDAGHYAELTARIDRKKQGINPVIYPLLWLVMDFKQNYAPSTGYEYEVPRAQFFLVEKSNGTDSSLQRLEGIFKPVLIPVWETLKSELELSELILNPVLEATVTLHPYATGLNNKRANLFNDTVDALEVSDLSLLVNNKQIC